MHKGENHKNIVIERIGITYSFKLIFEQYYAALCYFADKIVQNQAEAEDIVEEVFIKLWQKEPDFSSHKNIKAVLYIAVKNACLNHVKQRRKNTSNLNAFTYKLQQETEGFVLLEMVRAEVLRELYAALQQLPVERRHVMELLFVEGWGSQKVAEHLDISAHTVKKHKLNGIKDLKKARITLFLLLMMLSH